MKPNTSESRRVVTYALLMLLSLAGCSESTNSTAAAAPGNAAQAQATAPVETASSLPARNTGTVMTNQMAGGYSYLEVDVDGAVFWLATSMSGAAYSRGQVSPLRLTHTVRNPAARAPCTS